jgi:hypothetical protein
MARISRPWILSAGANAFDGPLFHFAFDPRGRPTAELHRFWEVPFLDRVVNAAPRLATDGEHFLKSEEPNVGTIARRTAFNRHIDRLLIHVRLQSEPEKSIAAA